MKRTRRPLTTSQKLLYSVIIIAAVAGLCYLAYYLTQFTYYDAYKQYLSSYTYEEGSEYSASKTSLQGKKDYKLVTENDTLQLYLNKKTTDVAVLDKRTGEVTFGIPQDADQDPVANAANKKVLKSHLIVDFFNASRTKGTYDSFSMSVDKEQFDFEAIENGVRVIYTLGDFSKSIGRVTSYLTPEKFDEICDALPDEGKEIMAKYYREKSDVAGMRQLLSAAKTNKKTKRLVDETLAAAGFTEEECVEQMALAGAEVSIPNSFVVPLEYRLEGDHLDVSIPVSGIEEKGGSSIYRIQVLNAFGAQDSNGNGYIVVPNGDGSIINFNNGKVGAVGNYSQFVYGIDLLAADYTLTEYSNEASMALFGMCKETGTILTTIEDGASLASVTAGVSGRINNYNYVYASFVIRGSETLEMFGTTGNEASLPLIEPMPYDHNLKLRYTFLDADHQGYVGIADYLRNRLITEGVLKEKTENKDIKLYYDVITGVEMTEYFLGKQYMGLTAMTTFDQAGQIASILKEKGVANQVMNLQGWFNGGYYHDAADRIRVTSKLGGRKGLEKLNDTVAENGGSLFVDVALQKVSFDSKHFNYQAESSKYFGSGYVAAFGQVNPVTLRQTASLGYMETQYNLISPKFLVRYVTKFADKISDYNVDGISLRDLGSQLHSDKKRTEQIHREEALDIVTAMLDKMDSIGKNILLNKSNDYAWRYADDIINLPLDDNDYIIVDANIPLYEMIIHGAIDYSGGIYNLNNSCDDRSRILTMLEYGAAPHFVFTWEETNEMKYSGMNGWYASTFETWADKAADVYQEVNSVLGRVSGERMVSHEILGSGVRKVVYSNGVTIYVNYSNRDAAADGLTIPAMGYKVL